MLSWYRRNARDLPWRRTRDPYRIWVSEIMLQQTRVAAAVPYYERFLKRFPDVKSLARAKESDVLAAWSGLGYYSRARNLHQAAKQILARGAFPDDYDSLRELPGVGPYTAAAIASIAFGLPRAVVDGNVRRVISRLTCGSGRAEEVAEDVLDRKRPGEFNQALMELGATVCLPREPKCPMCPVADLCEARRQGRQADFPIRPPRPARVRVTRTLVLAMRNRKVLLALRNGFWELPEIEQVPDAAVGRDVGQFRHSIMNHDYTVTVREARVSRAPRGCEWVVESNLYKMPLSTMTRKALARSSRTVFGGGASAAGGPGSTSMSGSSPCRRISVSSIPIQTSASTPNIRSKNRVN